MNYFIVNTSFDYVLRLVKAETKEEAILKAKASITEDDKRKYIEEKNSEISGRIQYARAMRLHALADSCRISLLKKIDAFDRSSLSVNDSRIKNYEQEMKEDTEAMIDSVNIEDYKWMVLDTLDINKEVQAINMGEEDNGYSALI